jgi:hypothetical protein
MKPGLAFFPLIQQVMPPSDKKEVSEQFPVLIPTNATTRHLLLFAVQTK